MERDPILEQALSRRNAVRDIALRCHITAAAVSQWPRVPERHLQAVAEVVGVAPEQLRPDLFGEGVAADRGEAA